MIFWTRERNMYPEQGPKERAAEIKRIVAVSGPEYRDGVEATILLHEPEFSLVRWKDGTSEAHWAKNMSLASWYILRAAEPGETVILKMRCDDVAGKR